MKYLIWDFDGTLGYREGGMWTLTLLEIVQQALPELTVTREQLKSFLRMVYPWHMPDRPHLELQNADKWWESLQPVFRRALMGVGVPEEQANVLAGQFRYRYTDLTRWRLFPDTLPTLKTLSANGWRHIVLSNHVPELPEILRHLGVIDQVVAVFNSAQTGYEKPHPQAFRIALDFIGDAEAVWMIGDNYTADVCDNTLDRRIDESIHEILGYGLRVVSNVILTHQGMWRCYGSKSKFAFQARNTQVIAPAKI